MIIFFGEKIIAKLKSNIKSNNYNKYTLDLFVIPVLSHM